MKSNTMLSVGYGGLFFLILIGGCVMQSTNNTIVSSYTKDVDALGDLIDQKGKDIDRLGAFIDSSTDHMEDDIEARGRDIDSPEANKLIEVRGEDIDKISDVMDREVESKGNLVETEVTGSKHMILPDGSEGSGGNPVDVASRRVVEQGSMVDKIGNMIERNTRNIVPKILSKHFHTHQNKHILLKADVEVTGSRKSGIENDESNRKVIVPVNKRKLNKLLAFYYMKKKYPGYVQHLLQEEQKGEERSPLQNKDEDVFQQFILPKLGGDSNDSDEKVDKIMSTLMQQDMSTKTMFETNVTGPGNYNTGLDVNLTDDVDSRRDKPVTAVTDERTTNVIDSLQKVDDGRSVNTHVNKRVMKNLKDYFKHENSADESSATTSLPDHSNFKAGSFGVTGMNCGGVKCVVKELVNLLDKTYLQPGNEHLGHQFSVELTGSTRGGGDPYASIGHASVNQARDSDHIEENHHTEHAGEFTEAFHHHNHHNHHPHFEHSMLLGHHNRGHHHDDNHEEEGRSDHHEEHEDQEEDGNLHHGGHFLDETAELEHMIHSMPDLNAVNFGDNIHNAVPHHFQRLHHEEDEEKDEHHNDDDRQHEDESRDNEKLQHEGDHHKGHYLGHNFHHLEEIHHIGHHGDEMHGSHDGYHMEHRHRDQHRNQDSEHNQDIVPSTRQHDSPAPSTLQHDSSAPSTLQHDSSAPSTLQHDSSAPSTNKQFSFVPGKLRSMDSYKPYEYVDEEEDPDVHLDVHHDKEHHHEKKHRKKSHQHLHHVYEHIHHHENPIVHIDHDDDYYEDPGEDIHNTHEMLINQGTHVHVHEHPHEDMEDDDTIPIPGVAHEGPISTVSVFQDRFRGPGIHDQPDVHYEEEMDATQYRKRREMNSTLSKRGDPYASIGHYPEQHMDIGELEHEHIESDHGEHGYGWDPSPHHKGYSEHHGGELGFGYGHHGGHHGYGYGGGYSGHHGGGYGGHHGDGHGGNNGGFGRGHAQIIGGDHMTSFHGHHVFHGGYNGHYHGMHHGHEHGGYGDEGEGFGWEGEDGYDDHADHGHHIHEPDPEPHHFNNHIHPAIPHIYEQLEHEPLFMTHGHGHHDNDHHHDHHHDHEDHRHMGHHHHPEPEPEHQDDHNHDEHRIVHVDTHHWLHKRGHTGNYIRSLHHDNGTNTKNYSMPVETPTTNATVNKTYNEDKDSKHRVKRYHHHYHRYYHHHYGDDGDYGGDGRDVARLSYLTEKYGRDMTHDIDEGTHDVEAVGDEIERGINHGIESVSHFGYEAEAPDYDRDGHFYPNVHENDVEDEVDRVFPRLSQRQLIEMVQRDRFRQHYIPMSRPIHIHHDKDDNDDDDDDDDR